MKKRGNSSLIAAIIAAIITMMTLTVSVAYAAEETSTADPDLMLMRLLSTANTQAVTYTGADNSQFDWDKDGKITAKDLSLAKADKLNKKNSKVTTAYIQKLIKYLLGECETLAIEKQSPIDINASEKDISYKEAIIKNLNSNFKFVGIQAVNDSQVVEIHYLGADEYVYESVRFAFTAETENKTTVAENAEAGFKIVFSEEAGFEVSKTATIADDTVALSNYNLAKADPNTFPESEIDNLKMMLTRALNIRYNEEIQKWYFNTTSYGDFTIICPRAQNEHSYKNPGLYIEVENGKFVLYQQKSAK
jgi:hypothetical protein